MPSPPPGRNAGAGGHEGGSAPPAFCQEGQGGQMCPFLEKTTIVNTFFSLKEEGSLCTLKSMTTTY